MSEKVSFSAFDPIRFDTPAFCDVCTSDIPVFRYEYDSDRGTPQSRQGFCCAACATKLLERLQRTESQVWADEAAILKAEGLDVSDLEERQLAASGSTVKGR
jgi:transposase-like protein